MKNSILILLLSIAACGPKDPIDHYEMNKLAERFTDLNNQVGILQAKVSAMDVQLKIVQGTQDVYVDNYIGMKIKFDLLARDVCPKCNFTSHTQEPTVRVDVRPKKIEDTDVPPLD